MGYTTDFHGSFSLDKPLTVAHLNYLQRFAEVRHMNWIPDVLEEDDDLREQVGLPKGESGEFCVDIHDCSGARGLINYNDPGNCPSLWCGWVPTEDGREIEWDGGEKFYNYVAWLKFITANFLEPWGYKLNGEVEWRGEDSDDRGVIYCQDNKVEAVDSEIRNPGPSWRNK